MLNLGPSHQTIFANKLSNLGKKVLSDIQVHQYKFIPNAWSSN